MHWWQFLLVFVSWVIVWFTGYIKGEDCGWTRRGILANNYHPDCFECGELVETNDDAYVCIECGGRNKRYSVSEGEQHG